MARRLSRRIVTTHVADRLVAGDTKVITELAGYLIETRQSRYVTLYIRDIEAVLASRGYVNGTVTTAFALDSAVHKALESFIAKATGAKHVTLTRAVDRSALGGFKVTLPGREIDATIARQLTILKTSFKKA